jgi:HlyD family secretion protein
MGRGWVLPTVAGVGLLFAAAVSVTTERAPVPAEPVQWPPSPPFNHFIAGSGIVEALGGNIQVGTSVPGIVTAVPVDTGFPIRLGELLFEVDNRIYVANRSVAQANLEQAIANLEKLIASPRPQEKGIAAADLAAARAQADQARTRLERVQRLGDLNALSAVDREAALYGAEAYEAAAKGAALRFDIAKEGTWEKDLEIARAGVKVAQAQLERSIVDLAMTRVTSPLDGVVLFRGVDPGNYVGGPTPMIIGETASLRVRTDIDEVDAWRFSPEAPAYAFLRGNNQVQIPLRFDHYESLVQPKRSLTLANDERVDTRVLQVIYTLQPAVVPVPIYVGQLLDVFIESLPIRALPRPDVLPPALQHIEDQRNGTSSINRQRVSDPAASASHPQRESLESVSPNESKRSEPEPREAASSPAPPATDRAPSKAPPAHSPNQPPVPAPPAKTSRVVIKALQVIAQKSCRDDPAMNWCARSFQEPLIRVSLTSQGMEFGSHGVFR